MFSEIDLSKCLSYGLFGWLLIICVVIKLISKLGMQEQAADAATRGGSKLIDWIFRIKK